MRPGYDADDMYRMVEDEFTATAALFTAHLHHAEYQRLRKLASTRSPKTLKSLTRGVDANASISNELRMQKEAEKQREKTSKSLKKSGISRTKSSKSKEDDESEDSDAAVQRLIARARNAPTDQWRGTHVDEFMRTSASAVSAKEKQGGGPSLVGLQGIRSDTRASRGFISARERHLRDQKPHEVYGQTVKQDPGASSGEEGDDLDSTAAARKRLGKHRKDSSTTKTGSTARSTRSPEIKRDPDAKSSSSATRTTGRTKTNLAALFDELDRPSPPPADKTAPPSRLTNDGLERKGGKRIKVEPNEEEQQRVTAVRGQGRGKSKVKEGGKTEEGRRAADEIPLFLAL